MCGRVLYAHLTINQQAMYAKCVEIENQTHHQTMALTMDGNAFYGMTSVLAQEIKKSKTTQNNLQHIRQYFKSQCLVIFISFIPPSHQNMKNIQWSLWRTIAIKQ